MIALAEQLPTGVQTPRHQAPSNHGSDSVGEPHLSHSQVSGFTDCPRRWHYSHVEQAPRERTSIALLLGSALHEAAAQANEAALAGTTCDAVASFSSAFDAALTTSPVPVHGQEEASDLRTKGIALAAAYKPPPDIIGVEQPFILTLAPDLPPVTGRIDLIRKDEAGRLILADLKSTATKTLADPAAVAAQLGLYDCAYPASSHEAILLVKTKVPSIAVVPVRAWSRGQVVRHYREVHHAMQAGVRYAVRSWSCPSCPYRDRCAADS